MSALASLQTPFAAASPAPTSVDRLNPDATGVLLVEDDRNIGTVLSILLEDAEFDVTWVTSLKAANAHLATHDALVAVVDRRLADGDGLSLVGRLRAFPASAVVVMSGVARAWEREPALAAGADGYLEKPFATADLLAVVHQLAEASRARRGLLSAEHERVGLAPRWELALQPGA